VTSCNINLQQAKDEFCSKNLRGPVNFSANIVIELSLTFYVVCSSLYLFLNYSSRIQLVHYFVQSVRAIGAGAAPQFFSFLRTD
jgi:hypothetical protein